MRTPTVDVSLKNNSDSGYQTLVMLVEATTSIEIQGEYTANSPIGKYYATQFITQSWPIKFIERDPESRIGHRRMFCHRFPFRWLVKGSSFIVPVGQSSANEKRMFSSPTDTLKTVLA